MMVGILATIPANKIMEMPLPIPLLLICSPSHINKAAPAVKVNTITIAENHWDAPLLYMVMLLPDGSRLLRR